MRRPIACWGQVEMAFNVFQTAAEEGVHRVVMASSNHAADYYEELILDHKCDVVDPDGLARSDNCTAMHVHYATRFNELATF
jgi:hypothetical protein